MPSLFPICWASPPETPSNHVCYTCGFPSFCPRVSFHCGSTVCKGQIHELKNPYPQGNSGYKDGVAENEYHENTVVWDVSSGWRVSLGIHHKGGCILLQMICVPWGCLNKVLQLWVAWNNRNIFSHTPGGPRIQDHGVSIVRLWKVLFLSCWQVPSHCVLTFSEREVKRWRGGREGGKMRMRKRMNKFAGVSSNEGTNPIIKVPSYGLI